MKLFIGGFKMKKKYFIDEDRKIIFSDEKEYFKRCIREAKNNGYTKIDYSIITNLFQTPPLFFDIIKECKTTIYRIRFFKNNTYWTTWAKNRKDANEIATKYIKEGLKEETFYGKIRIIYPDTIKIQKFTIKYARRRI